MPKSFEQTGVQQMTKKQFRLGNLRQARFGEAITTQSKSRRRSDWVLLMLLLLPFCTPLLAQDNGAIEDIDLTSEDEQWLAEMLQVLDESTEIATKSRLNADFVPGTVTVLHGRDLEALGARNAWEALALIPGVMINQEETGNLFVAVRGFNQAFNSGNVKVLLNSVPMTRDNSGLPSQALSLPIEQVDRIEFVRGPGSVLYGDYAFNGVLNILTRKESNKAFGRVDEHGTATLGGQYAYRSEDGATRFSLNVAGLNGNSVEAPEGVSAEDDQKSVIATFARQGFQFTAQAINKDYQNDRQIARDETTYAFEARQNFDLNPATRFSLYASYVHNDAEQTALRRLKGHTWEGGAELSWQGMERHHWLMQLSYTDNSIDEAFQVPPSLEVNPQPDPPPPGPPPASPPVVDQRDVNRRYFGISLQDRFEVSDRLAITAGLRFDHRDDLDLNLVTPRLAAVWRLSDAHILKAQYAEGYRAPTFWELYPNNVKIDLEPETIATTELSYIHRSTDRVVRLTLFHSRLEDHIKPLGPPTFDFDNAGSSRAAGVELEWEQQWSSQLKSWLNVSYADSRDGRRLSSPEMDVGADQDPATTDWLANLALFYRPADRALLTVHWNYVGERHAETVDTTGEHRVALTLSLFDLWTEGLTLRLGVRNLLQEDQRSVIGSPNRVLVNDFPDSLFWGQVSYDF
ncbi:MAG: TonB-dependent receptor [Candidatus Competibacteraceae bacterium]